MPRFATRAFTRSAVRARFDSSSLFTGRIAPLHPAWQRFKTVSERRRCAQFAPASDRPAGKRGSAPCGEPVWVTGELSFAQTGSFGGAAYSSCFLASARTNLLASIVRAAGEVYPGPAEYPVTCSLTVAVCERSEGIVALRTSTSACLPSVQPPAEVADPCLPADSPWQRRRRNSAHHWCRRRGIADAAGERVIEDNSAVAGAAMLYRRARNSPTTLRTSS